MDKASQIRELREARLQSKVTAVMRERSAPSPAKVKETADRAEARSSTVEPFVHNGSGEGSIPSAPTTLAGSSAVERLPVKQDVARSIRARSATKGKTNKMPAVTQSSDFDKNNYQRLYLRMRRAMTDEKRAAAEAELREAFPNTRPRANKIETPLPITKPANQKPPKPLRSVKALKRSLNGKKSRKAKRGKR